MILPTRWSLVVVCCGLLGCSRHEQSSAGAPKTQEWTASQDGVGLVRLGMSRRQLTARGGVVNSESEACEFVVPQGAPPGVRAMVVNDVVRRVDVSPPGVRTSTGVGVGSTEAAVIAAYPGARVLPHKYTSGHYVTADLSPGALGTRRMVFETDGATVTRYRVGFAPEVDWVEGCG